MPMSVFSEVERDQIQRALKRSGVTSRACAMCGTSSWILADGWVFLSLTDNFNGLEVGGPGLPCVALSCAKCGDTHLFNALVLGLRELVDRASGVPVQ